MHLHTSTHTHPPTPTHTYIHTWMYVCYCVWQLFFVQNAVLKSMCMLYLSPSLYYIDSLCNFPAKMLTSVYNAHNNKNNNNDKKVISIAQLSLSVVLKMVQSVMRTMHITRLLDCVEQQVSSLIPKFGGYQSVVRIKYEGMSCSGAFLL